MSKKLSGKYYQDSKERLPKQDCESLSKAEKRSYGCEQYKNLPENEKQRLFKYKKNITK